MKKDVNAIVYNSDLIIRNASELATLCVFYDKVYLPYTSPATCDLFAGPRFFDVRMPRGMDRTAEEQFIDDVGYWSRVYYPLILEKVVERLPQPPWGEKPPLNKLSTLNLSERIKQLTKASSRTASRSITIGKSPLGEGDVEENIKEGVIKEDLIKQDLALHFLRPDVDLPQLFIYEGTEPSRELLKAVEARATFDYLLPAIGYLNAEEILQVREKVKDLREGFSMHLQKLSKGVEDALKGDESLNEIDRWAKSVVETELIPDYREFRRQLAAQRSGFWSKVLDATAKVFQIEAAPWTPKFYGEFLKAIGVTILTATAERKDSLSNKSQAYHFMRLVEESDLMRADKG